MTMLSAGAIIWALLNRTVPFGSSQNIGSTTAGLLTAARQHVYAMAALKNSSKFDSLLVATVADILSTEVNRLQAVPLEDFPGPAHTSAKAKLFRWCHGGTGILPLDLNTAEHQWQKSQLSDSVDMPMVVDGTGREDSINRCLAALVHPESRLCLPGNFDLSITLR